MTTSANGALSSIIDISAITESDTNVMAVMLLQAHIQVDLAYMKLQNAEVLTAHFEGQLGIESCWEVGGTDYNQYKEEAMLGKYWEALYELEHLVVMHLFELSKLLMLDTGE